MFAGSNYEALKLIVKLEQAKKALKFCLGQLTATDRFAMIEFAAKVNKYRGELTEAKADEMDMTQVHAANKP